MANLHNLAHNYSSNIVVTLCVMCKLSEETMDHFMNCTAYGNETCDIRWKDIFENDTDVQHKIAIEIKRRQVLRKLEIDKL